MAIINSITNSYNEAITANISVNRLEANLSLNRPYVSYDSAELFPPGYEDESNVGLRSALDFITHYYIPFLFVIGPVGNILSCVVFAERTMRTLSSSHYIIAILISDTIYLFTLCHNWVVTEYGMSLYWLGGWCQCIIMMSYSSVFLSLWYTVCFFIDRCIAVTFPDKESTACTVGRAKIAIICLAIVAIVVYLNISITVGATMTGTTAVCGPLHRFTDVILKLNNADVVVNGALPIICILIISVIVGTHLLIAYRERVLWMRSYRGTRQIRERADLDEYGTDINQTTFFVACLIFYIVCNVPMQFMKTYNMATAVGGFASFSSKYMFLQQIFSHLHHTKLALNIVIFLFFYRGFRKYGKKQVSDFMCKVIGICRKPKQEDEHCCVPLDLSAGDLRVKDNHATETVSV